MIMRGTNRKGHKDDGVAEVSAWIAKVCGVMEPQEDGRWQTALSVGALAGLRCADRRDEIALTALAS
jgi:hypothetical protein